jgi:hypothetical protein
MITFLELQDSGWALPLLKIGLVTGNFDIITDKAPEVVVIKGILYILYSFIIL